MFLQTVGSKSGTIWQRCSRRLDLLLGIILVSVGCSAPTQKAGGRLTVQTGIDCQLLYRTWGDEVQREEATLALGAHGETKTAAFDDLKLEAQYWEDQGEGRSLTLSVICSAWTQIKRW